MGLMERLDKKAPSTTTATTQQAEADESAQLRDRVHLQVVETLNKREEKHKGGADETETRAIIESTLEEQAANMARPERNRIAVEIYDSIRGLGPLEKLLADDSISEIMVNGAKQVFIERKGKLLLSDVTFYDNDQLLNVIDRIVSPLGRHIDEATPMVDARLPDGSRVNAIIPPLSLKGPLLTIRKFSRNPLTAENLISYGSLTFKIAAFLEACVKGRLNIVVSGGTGSGKTTLLNVLSAYIPHDERIVTIEDAAEIQLQQKHVLTLEARPANLEGKGQIAIRDLVRNALRMRPDRIVVGEVRGGEALDMLQAMNTGHDGSMTTGHANSTRDMLARLETMVLMAGMSLPISAIRQQIASAIDIIVQQTRLRDGTRKITSISEVLGMEGDVIVTQEIFSYDLRRRAFAGTLPRNWNQAPLLRQARRERRGREGRVVLLIRKPFEEAQREGGKQACYEFWSRSFAALPRLAWFTFWRCCKRSSRREFEQRKRAFFGNTQELASSRRTKNGEGAHATPPTGSDCGRALRCGNCAARGGVHHDLGDHGRGFARRRAVSRRAAEPVHRACDCRRGGTRSGM